VALAEEIGEGLQREGYKIKIVHRDFGRS